MNFPFYTLCYDDGPIKNVEKPNFDQLVSAQVVIYQTGTWAGVVKNRWGWQDPDHKITLSFSLPPAPAFVKMDEKLLKQLPQRPTEHKIVSDGYGGGHNGEYVHKCTECGLSDWIPSYGMFTQLSFYDKPCPGKKKGK